MKRKRLLSLILIIIVTAASMVIFPGQRAYGAAPSVQRLFGDHRYLTAVRISEHGWNKSDTVVIATGEDFPDALCATPLAKKYNSPILLVRKDRLDEYIGDEIVRLGVKNAFLIGGTGVISGNVEKQIKTLVQTVTRIGGRDRFETSALVAEKLGTVNEAVIVTGSNYPDALSIAPVASQKGIPILLSETDLIPSGIINYLSGKTISKYYVIGGPGAIGSGVYDKLKNAERIYGSDRYGTNTAILDRFSSQLEFGTAYIATGEDFPDALAGAALAQLTDSPLILVGDRLSDTTLNFIKPILPSIDIIDILGGEGAVSTGSVTLLIYNGAYYDVVQKGTYQYTEVVKLQNKGSVPISNVNLEFIIGELSNSVYQSDMDIQVTGTGASMVTDISGVRKAQIKLASLDSGKEIQYKIERKLNNGGIKYNSNLSQTSGDYSGFKDYSTYTSPEDKIESDNPLIKKKASEILNNEKNPYIIAKKIFEYVNTSLEYDYSEGNNGALNALETGRGVCEDFADLFVALLRASGVPARVAGGFWVQDTENLNSGDTMDISADRHAWAEFYIPEYGWIVAEPTVIKSDGYGERVPAFETFANLDSPGHIITGYSGSSEYSLRYEYNEGIKPDINVEMEDFIRKY